MIELVDGFGEKILVNEAYIMLVSDAKEYCNHSDIPREDGVNSVIRFLGDRCPSGFGESYEEIRAKLMK